MTDDKDEWRRTMLARIELLSAIVRPRAGEAGDVAWSRRLRKLRALRQQVTGEQDPPRHIPPV